MTNPFDFFVYPVMAAPDANGPAGFTTNWHGHGEDHQANNEPGDTAADRHGFANDTAGKSGHNPTQGSNQDASSATSEASASNAGTPDNFTAQWHGHGSGHQANNAPGDTAADRHGFENAPAGKSGHHPTAGSSQDDFSPETGLPMIPIDETDMALKDMEDDDHDHMLDLLI